MICGSTNRLPSGRPTTRWRRQRSTPPCGRASRTRVRTGRIGRTSFRQLTDRKSTRLNSSHVAISYAVFCLKKKKKIEKAHDIIIDMGIDIDIVLETGWVYLLRT